MSTTPTVVMDSAAKTVGIIGGADAPTTFWIMLRFSVFGRFINEIVLCIALIITSVVFKILSKKQKAEA